jgi:hypothetical protein
MAGCAIRSWDVVRTFFLAVNGEIMIPSGRHCGACSLCCKLLKVIELDKPANQWCGHCRPGRGGCSIYETRPQICRSYYCGWMLSENVSDDWYPLTSRMVLSYAPIGGIQTVTVTVDPRYPEVWTKAPYYPQLKRMAERGLHVVQASEILLVQVRVSNRVWLILPNTDAEITKGSYVLKLNAPGEWDVELFDSSEAAAKRSAELTMSVSAPE